MLNKKIWKLFKILMDPYYVMALGKGVAAAVEHGKLLSSLTCSVVVDVGANRGQFALVARTSFPDAKIISFEPLSEPASVFQRMFSKDRDVLLHKFAIGPAPDKATMHVSGRDDSSSLLPISPLQEEIFPGTGQVGVENVRVAPLDLLLGEEDINGPAILKIDVQGFEMAVLRGCESLLSKFQWIYCECSFVELYSGQKLAPEIIEWLANKGFYIQGIYNPSYDHNGRAIQADFLFSEPGDVG